MERYIYYWRGSAEIRVDLVRVLEQTGSRIRETRDLDAVVKAKKTTEIALLIADGSAGERESSTRMVELSAAPKLFDVPTVFLAKEADSRGSVLKKQYRHFLPIDFPYQLDVVVPQILELMAGHFFSAEEGGEAGNASIASEAEVEEGEAVEEEEAEAVDEAEAIIRPEQVELHDEEAPDAKEMPPLLPAVGQQFSFAQDVADFQEDEIMPELIARDLMRDVLGRLTKTDRWLGVHARRVSLLSGTLMQTISPSVVHQSNARAVSLLLNWGSLEKPREFRTMDFFRDLNEDNVSLLLEALQATGEFLSSRIEDELAARTIRAMSALLRRDHGSEFSDVIDDARCVMACEFAGRSCWRKGYWDPVGAYRVLTKLRKKEPIDFGDHVTPLLARTVGESVTHEAVKTTVLLPTIRQRNEATFTPPSDPDRHVRAVVISQLLPGMRLAWPLRARDGEILLDADIELDFDLIWRLWQLAALRPIESHARITV